MSRMSPPIQEPSTWLPAGGVSCQRVVRPPAPAAARRPANPSRIPGGDHQVALAGPVRVSLPVGRQTIQGRPGHLRFHLP